MTLDLPDFLPLAGCPLGVTLDLPDFPSKFPVSCPVDVRCKANDAGICGKSISCEIMIANNSMVGISKTIEFDAAAAAAVEVLPQMAPAVHSRKRADRLAAGLLQRLILTRVRITSVRITECKEKVRHLWVGTVQHGTES